MKTALLSIIISFVISLIISPLIIKVVRKLKSEQNVLNYVEKHKNKNGTLTLGGLIFILTTIIVFFIFWDGKSYLSLIGLFAMFFYGVLGFLDDFIKIKFKRNLGLKAYQKFIGQFGIALIIAIFAYKFELVGSVVAIPFSNIEVDIGFLIIPFIVLFYLSVTNSVNLTDGLDGLAGGVGVVLLISFIPIVQLILLKNPESTSNLILDEYKNIMILCGCCAGGLLTFLIFNSFPAKIFMGDTGSLALGGLISSVLTFTKQYLLIFIVGFVFVVTVFSSLLQVCYFKLTKKRIFKMAPLHHHFELCGIKETKIVAIYIITTILLNLMSIVLFM